MKLDVSQPQIVYPRLEAFRKRFSEAHLHLAYHAALPLALTPDLLYRLWANFQQDVNGALLEIPWVAVADLLLSSLCDEVGHELYEMDRDVRSALLDQLRHDTRFGQPRLQELSDFLLTYVQQQLDSPDIDIRDRAEAQRWAAIAYTQPDVAAQELSRILASTYQHDKTECLRVAAIVETLAEPLAEFEPLLTDARDKASAVRSGETIPAPPSPQSKQRLYWAIGIVVTALLSLLWWWTSYIPQPNVKPSPTLTPSPSPGRSPATASPSPSPTVTTPAPSASPSPDPTSTQVPSTTTQPDATPLPFATTSPSSPEPSTSPSPTPGTARPIFRPSNGSATGRRSGAAVR